MSQEIYSVNVSIPLVSGGTLAAAGTTIHPFFAVPGTANGGGITIAKLSYSSNAAIAAGSAPTVGIVTLNSSSLPIGTPCLNGSAAFTAGTVSNGTITTAWVPGTVGFLGVRVGQGIYGASTTVVLNVNMQYYLGRGSA